jgi:hypothetical protein
VDVFQELLDEGVELHKNARFKEAEIIYNRLLNRMPFDEALTYLLSDIHLRRGNHGLAIQMLTHLLNRNNKHGPGWVNLGIAFRKENEFVMAEDAWRRGIALLGETIEICNNMASLYSDRANPVEALKWLEKSLQKNPESVEAHWGKALALLNLCQWEEGWKEYEWRQKLPNWDSRPAVDVPYWDGSYVGHLYVHGEQGVGDEVMFASALPCVKAGRITVEVNAKVATLIQKSFPDVDVVTKPTPGDYDAKVGIGSLIGRFGFNKEPYLNPDPWTVKIYRERLEKLGKGPYVAIAWMGGMKETRIEDRSIQLQEFKSILDNFTCVSAQHWAGVPKLEEEVKDLCREFNLPILSDGSCGSDLHEQAALFKAVDYVVTVQQTAVHVAGAVGAKTHCLIGTHPHWRYGLDGDTLPWYSSVKLHRKKTDWNEAIERVRADLRTV